MEIEGNVILEPERRKALRMWYAQWKTTLKTSQLDVSFQVTEVKEEIGRSTGVPWRGKRWGEAPVLKVFPGQGFGAAERRTFSGIWEGGRECEKESTLLTFTQRL